MKYRFPAILAAQVSLIAVLASSGLSYAADTAPATEDEKVLMGTVTKIRPQDRIAHPLGHFPLGKKEQWVA